ncbi:MAG: DNA-protecting protein DprA [Deltaproteobacteria bacterium]|mgnify:CR=1 FL=1|nr:DNA-protecting protein DprA [Deltaproteobacteria bacterium]MBW2020465.1 DNA-protecting protein DprA [Deltaproteobacteria bacterium]MBW2074482.1 DNA-protecting protein DprA [Deltaproteobacteria bacterium]RLB80993.1 MAG: DNA-protecting protein DprA [Deltaproteobacteria bacterium]
MESLLHWLALKTVPGVGNRLFLHLIQHFGDPKKVFSASIEQLVQVEGVNARLASVIQGYKIPGKVQEDLSLAEKNGIRIITFSDPSYPTLLRHISDPPPVLYVYGTLQADSLNIAVVGSRNATTYGRTITERLSGDLVQRGFTVVSGMARGIDAAAHKGALAARGKTIAVLGCGLDTIYPAENKRLFHQIAESGAVISEFPCLTPPEAHNFPVRNRIISGLALGTVIVEATQKSGSLITARLAAEQGREVFAVPGSITSFKSMGTHRLIKQGAKLVEHVNDIIDELNIDQLIPPTGGNEKPGIPLTLEEKRLLNELSPYPVHIDKLVQHLSLSAAQVSSLLLQLELKGLVTQSPGKLFTRCDP